jgi:histone deacetylase 6
MGDAEYLAAFHQVVLPIAYQYNPQLVLVAAGFDAAMGDPLGGCKITPEGYGQMTHLLSSLAQGRVAILLEGGYNLESISHSMTMCAKALLGDPIPSPRIESPNQIAVSTIKRVINHLRPFWGALAFNVDLPNEDVLQLMKEEKETVKSLERQLEQLQIGSSISAVKEDIIAIKAIERQSTSADQIDSASGGNIDDSPIEASGITEPQTLQELLLLPENIQVILTLS